MGAGDELIECVGFEADRRHAVHLVAQLDEILARHSLAAADLDEVYVSAGPGSFTGLRIGVTVAAILSRSIAGLGCVAVPTVEAVAENAVQAGIDGHIGVIMDAKDSIYAVVFAVCAGQAGDDGQPGIIAVEQFLADAPRPITLLGEGLGHHRLSGEGIIIADSGLWLPRAEGVWRVGRREASKGRFAQTGQIRPFYLRRPAAEET